MLEAHPRTSFHHQPEAQHPKSSAIHKPKADYPIFWHKTDMLWLAGDAPFQG
jgi:hypothetical protein